MPFVLHCCATQGNAKALIYKELKFPSGLGETWWSQGESNPRPLECHSSALPTELWPHRRRGVGTSASKQQVRFPGQCVLSRAPDHSRGGGTAQDSSSSSMSPPMISATSSSSSSS